MLINGQAEDRINTVINMSSVSRGARSQISVWREQCSQGNMLSSSIHLLNNITQDAYVSPITAAVTGKLCFVNNESFLCVRKYKVVISQMIFIQRLKN